MFRQSHHICAKLIVNVSTKPFETCEACLPEPVLAFFIQDLRGGGAERSVARLLNGIVARDISTDLIVIERKGPFLDELDARVNVIELPQHRTMTSVPGLKRYIETRRPAAVVSSMTHTNVAAIVANLAARPRARLVVVEHNQHSRNVKLTRGLVRLSYRMVPLIYPKADLVAAVSEGVRDDLARITGIRSEQIAVLHNPVVDDAFEKSAVAEIDHPWLQSPGPPVVLGVGRFTRQKNFALLIEAFAVARKSRALRLIILGEGELRGELEAKVRALGVDEDVDLPGFDANPFRFMRHAAVYVLSSDWEGLPTTLIEAMACGTPVVSTDCESGPHEILLGGKLSRIVPVGSASALASAILATLETPGDREARIARANDFSLNRAVDRYLEAAGWLQ
jgi:glycosyltransferase involved in cell wall biosynthesis